MDWSLVLASQGIETSIGAPAEERGWHLTVTESDYRRALESLRQYRQENRARRWLHPVPGSDLVFDFSSGVWLVLLTAFYAIDAAQFGHLRAVGMVDSPVVQAGEWWRLFTAIMLHADLAHLAANLTTGFEGGPGTRSKGLDSGLQSDATAEAPVPTNALIFAT